VAGFIIEALPDHVALVAVEGDDRGALGADLDDDLVPFNERRRGDAEEEVAAAQGLEHIHLPDLVPPGGVPAGQHSRDPVGVDLTAGGDRRGGWSQPEDAEEGSPRIALAPLLLAARRVPAGDLLLVLVLDLEVQINLAVRDDGRAVRVPDRL